MKTIEEKAKAYDEIIERAKTMLAAGEVMYGKDNNASQLITDLIPDLKESEDEKVWQWIREHINHDGTNMFDKAVDWLERQKEQKPVNAAYISGIREELLGIEDNAKNIDGLTESQWVAIRAAHRLLGEYVEQEQKPAEKQDYSGLTDFERAIHRGFLCAGVENVPVTIIKETAQDCLAHLPAEWSEEDEYCKQQLIAFCENCMQQDANAIRCADWLKSIRPSWKPTSDQIALVTRVCNNLHLKNSNDATEMDKLSKQLGDLYWKGSVESWKPSEEQMKALIDCTIGNEYDVHALVRLWAELKNL